ncbi:hypothetical protein D9Q98_005527 [Chlorella vulgaris]|uniref:Alpha-aminoacylpeptide hydrolase n=1 Tax=Chlorella vulgaris TaxID=3077 RepID=A0A9D4TM83_CHLVU|nr:hypothetical protein D9Q98_005527 [Chlorella vulgaris]
MADNERTPVRPSHAFTLSEEEELHHLHDPEHAALSPGSSSAHRPQNVFNLDLEYSDDDALLDWEQYAGMNRMRCCGIDCSRSPFARCLRPPQWWYTYTKRQRRCMVGTLAGVVALVAVLAALIALAAVRGGRGPTDTSWHTGDPSADALGTAEELALCSWGRYRLPTTVVPQQYNLTLEVSMEGEYPVEGMVAIDLKVLQATQCVVLHAADMEIVEARLAGAGNAVGKVKAREAEQQLIIAFDADLPQPAAALLLTFRYKLKEGLSGFYRSTYKLADGSARSLATTQFEANAARLAFPCFDEPAFKAVFNTEIIAPAHLEVLYNMPPSAIHSHAHNVDEHTRTWHFQPTPPMSTYLVCFIVGEFASTSRLVESGSGTVNVSVWGTPDRVNNLEYAADTAAAILPAFEAALGVSYPLPKLDLVAIPDFSAGAMENWGLITYRETALLASNSSSTLDLRYVAIVVAHEMAHQWFGNLVTMEFWGELWLNEGFASYFEYLGATAAHPDNSYWSTFYSDNLPAALYFDSKESSHPLSMDHDLMNSTNRIESVFDAVMYQKGASVLRMLRAWTNRANRKAPLPTHETVPGTTYEQDAFLLALKQYLQQHSYNNTHASDLWNAANATLPFDVPAAMVQWTYQAGYPLVSLTLDDRRRVWLHQAPFSLRGVSACDPSRAWWIPISYVTSDKPQQLQWTELRGCQSAKPLLTLKEGVGAASWVKLNAQQYGFYRVQYEPLDLWAALADAATAKGAGGGMLLSGSDLAGLIDDSYSLAEAGAGPITPFLNLLTALQVRPPQDYEPWAAALPYIFKLQRLLPCYTDWQAWVRDGLLHSYLRQGAAGGGRNASGSAQLLFSFNAADTSVPAEQRTVGYRLLRPAILRTAGLFADTGVKAAAANLFTQLEGPEGAAASQAPPNTLDADIRDAVYQSAARTDLFEVYQQLEDMYKAATEADEKERTLLALGYSPGGSRIQATLQFALSDDVRAQDARLVIVNVARNGGHSALDLTWTWLQQNHGALLAKLGGDAEALRRVAQVAEGVASLFSDAARQQQVDAFFANYKGKELDLGYAARSKESIAANAAWLAKHSADACAWVRAQRKSG